MGARMFLSCDYFNDFCVCEADSKVKLLSQNWKMFKVTFTFLSQQNISLGFLFTSLGNQTLNSLFPVL